MTRASDGSGLSNHRGVEETVQQQVNEANGLKRCLNNNVWTDQQLSTDTKVYRIYKSTRRPFMIYTTETRADTTRTQSLLKTAELRILQNVTNKALKDRMRIQEIKEISGIERINQWTKNRKIE